MISSRLTRILKSSGVHHMGPDCGNQDTLRPVNEGEHSTTAQRCHDQSLRCRHDLDLHGAISPLYRILGKVAPQGERITYTAPCLNGKCEIAIYVGVARAAWYTSVVGALFHLGS